MSSFRSQILLFGYLCIVCHVDCRLVTGQEVTSVVVARVIEAEVQSGQNVVGTVKPLRTSTIGSAVDGRVRNFLVNDGDMVEKGQTLAQLQTATLEIELAASQAELELSASRLAELENGSRPEDIAEADANRLVAEASVKFAESKLRRMESLSLRSAASDAELEEAKQQANATKFALKATEALLDRIKEGPRKELITQAKAQVELQQQRLNLIKDRLEKCTIVAPFDGFVSAEFTEIGDWINRGDPIVEVIQLDEVEIQSPVTVEAVVNLRIGDVIRVEFPELPNEIFTGNIDRIVPVAAARARTFPVHIRLKNRIEQGMPLLLSGMLARVNVPIGNRKMLPLVPKDALVLNGNDRSVFVVETNQVDGSESAKVAGVVRKVAVDLGVAVDGRIQVIGNVQADDLVVVEGNERLVPNTNVKIVSFQDPTNKN